MDYATINEIAEKSGLSYYVIYHRIKKLKVPVRRVGATLFIAKSSVHRLTAPVNKRHMKTHGESGSWLYYRWASMKSRCHNPKDPAFKHCGAKGIRVCDEWQSFEGFARDMGHPPTRKHRLIRDDLTGHFNPHNCRWATSVNKGRMK